MSGWAGTRLAMIVTVLLTATLVATPGGAQVYQWTDDNGTDHYASDLDRVPPARRAEVRVIQTPTPTGQTPAPTGQLPPTIQTPPLTRTLPPPAGPMAPPTGQTPIPSGDAAATPPGVLAATAGAPVLVDAHLNGVPLRLLVDTGASRTVLRHGVLARAGVDLVGARPVRLVGVGGAADGHEVIVPRLDIAGTTLGPLAILAYDVPELEADGLLGRDLLDGFVLTIDAARGRATLER